MFPTRSRSLLVLAGALAWTLAGCGDGHDHAAHDHGGATDAGGAQGHDDGAHVHTAPHGGALVVLREEFAHIEFVLDPETGRLTAWCLGAHAVQPVRVAAPTLELSLRVGDASFDVALEAVGSELTGETVGDSSEFGLTDPRLVGVERFEGTVRTVTLRGATFADVRFEYP